MIRAQSVERKGKPRGRRCGAGSRRGRRGGGESAGWRDGEFLAPERERNAAAANAARPSSRRRSSRVGESVEGCATAPYKPDRVGWPPTRRWWLGQNRRPLWSGRGAPATPRRAPIAASACGAKPACTLMTFTQGPWPPAVRRAGFWLVKPASLPRWCQSVLAGSPP